MAFTPQEIEFIPKMTWTSDFSLIHWETVPLVYSETPFSGQDCTMTYATTPPIKVNGISCFPAPFSVPKLTMCVSTKHLGHSIFVDLANGATGNVYNLLIGKNTAGTKEVRLVCNFTKVNNPSTTTTTITHSLDFVVIENGSETSRVNIYSNRSVTIATDSAVRTCEVLFGIALVLPPGRNPESFSSYLLMAIEGDASSPRNLNYLTFTNYTDTSAQGGTRTYKTNLNQTTTNAPGGNIGTLRLSAVFDLAMLESTYGVEPNVSELSPQAGPESVQGGMNEPAFDDRSDTIALPVDPNLNLSQMGFFNVYCTDSISSLNNLHDYVFGSAITTQSTTEDILKAIGNNIFNSKLIDYIVSCHVIPVAPIVDSTPTVTTVNLGNVTCSDVLMTKVRTDYVTFDCGSINLSEYYENFADFLETAKLFLPFIGFVPCRPEWFKNTTLSVQYKFNVIDGSCVAFVMSSGRYTNNSNIGTTVVGQYSGTASIRFPITGVSYASMATGVIGSIASMSVASGAGSMLGVAGSAINMAQQKPEIAQSNGYNACASMLGVRRPFLYIERPVSSYAKNYQHELGIPANIYAQLGSLTGYVRMDNVHLEGIPCTDEERNKIASLLKSGVVV